MGNINDYFDSPDYRLADVVRGELRRLGMMEAANEGSGARQAMPRSPNSEAAEIFGGDEGENRGFGVVVLPPGLFGADVRHVAYRIVRAAFRLEPTRNPLMVAVYRMLARLADQGVQTSMEAVTIGLLLGAAKVHGVRIKTHARDLAREVGVRYAVLLKVRRAAVAELAALPEERFQLGS